MAEYPRCLFCGTARAPSATRCPECGNRWVDMTIDEAVAPKPDRTAVAPVVSEVDVAAQTRTKRRRRWVFPLSITLAAVAVYAVVFAVLIERSGEDDREPDAATTTTSPDTTASPTSTTQGTDTTAATTAAPTTTTTAAPTTTATTVPTTTTTTRPPIDPVGRPIDLEDLTLGAFALGPLRIGEAGDSPLGRLVSTFGQPDEVREIGEADGLCPTETGIEARFGWLTVFVRDEGGEDVLAGYELAEPPGGGDHPTSELATISGAVIGDTVDRWRTIYRTSIVRVETIDGQSVLLLLRSSDERTLLWAPVDDESDPRLVTGINSPQPCDGGPFSNQ